MGSSSDPNAGRPLQVHFTQGPGAFFATFRSDGGGPAGLGAGGGAAPTPYDSDIIDAEVVRTTTITGRPSCTRRADRSYTRRP